MEIVGRLTTPLRTTSTTRTVDRVAAGLCFVTAVLLPINYGVLALGLSSFYLAAQSGVLHAVRLLDRQFPPSVRYAVSGIAFGVCFSLHAFVRALHSDVYLEHLGGPAVVTTGHAVVVGLSHVVVPLVSVVHLRGSVVPAVLPMAVAAVELAVITALHELVSNDQPRELTPPKLVQLLLSCIVSSSAWILLFETINRYFVRPSVE